MKELSLALVLGIESQAWQAEAACRDQHHVLFFPNGGTGKGYEAKRVCAGCVVRDDCLEFALANRLEYGVFGGLNERERRLERYRRKRLAERQLRQRA